jgi:DNA polymerase-3 subunit epsilon
MGKWKPIGQLPRAYLDTETTGLDPSVYEIIDITIIREYPGGAVDEWHAKVRPLHPENAHPKALAVNGFTQEKWADAPTFKEVAEQIAMRLSDCTVIGHNVSFDLDFVNAELKRAGVGAKISYHKIDTVTLAYEHLVPCGLEALSLDKIRDFLGWPKDNAHSALQDTRDAQRLYHLLAGAGHRQHLRWRIRSLYRKMMAAKTPKTA